MFQARWRWNLNRSLIVLRFRNGRRNPPPIQRMESDDLWPPCSRRRPRARRTSPARSRSPTTCSCARPSTTRSRGARRRRPRARCSSGIEAGEVRSTSSTPPSRRCSRTRSSPPGPTRSSTTRSSQNRRTNAVHAAAGPRRSTSPPSARSTPTPIDRVHAEIAPEPDARADELHDLLCVAGRRPRRATTGGRCSTSSAARGPGARCSSATARELWCATERAGDAASARSPATTTAVAAAAPRPPRDRAASPPSTALADADHARPRRGSPSGLAVLEHERLRAPGPLHRAGRRAEHRVGAPAGCWPACTPTRGARGASGVEPVTAQDFMRFLLRWQHVAPGTQLAGEAGLRRRRRAAPGLRGRGGRPGSPSCWPAGCATTDPAWLDRLCHDGEVALAAPHAPQPRRRRRAGGRAVQGHADRGRVPRRPAVAARRPPAPAASPASRRVGRDRRGRRGAARAGRLLRRRARRRHQPAARRRRARRCGTAWPAACSSPTASAPSALARSTGAAAARRRAPVLAPAPRGARWRHGAARAGRWSLVPAARRATGRSTATSWPRPSPSCCSTAGASCSATWRCTTRCGCPWRDLQWALRRLEDRGPGARRPLRQPGSAASSTRCPRPSSSSPTCASCPRTGERVTRQRHRPAQPGRRDRARATRSPPVRTNRVTYVDGVPEALAVAGTAAAPAEVPAFECDVSGVCGRRLCVGSPSTAQPMHDLSSSSSVLVGRRLRP